MRFNKFCFIAASPPDLEIVCVIKIVYQMIADVYTYLKQTIPVYGNFLIALLFTWEKINAEKSWRVNLIYNRRSYLRETYTGMGTMLEFLLEKQNPEWEKRTGGVIHLGEIHVWKAVLQDEAEKVKKYYASLSETEKDRAGRFRSNTIRRRFTMAHGIVREVLGNYLNLPAAAVEFASLPSGKPVLAGTASINRPALKFNLSHSEDLLLMAVSLEYDLGIDVESIEPGFDQAAVSKHFFAVEEMDWLQSLAPDQQAEAFFQLWTCKEAALKADGSGLRRNLENVKIEFDARKKLARCRLDSSKMEGDTWAIQVFCPEPGYTAALAFNLDASAAETPELKFFRWMG